MKSKAPLLLIEQMVMLLVFALAAALCMQAFVKSDEISRQCAARDSAVLAAQTAAETLRAGEEETKTAMRRAAGLLSAAQQSDTAFTVCYDEEWNPVSQAAAYRLEARTQNSGVAGLSRALVSVMREEDGETLFQIEVSWREVNADAR